jgi:hypothetical protein
MSFFASCLFFRGGGSREAGTTRKMAIGSMLPSAPQKVGPLVLFTVSAHVSFGTAYLVFDTLTINVAQAQEVPLAHRPSGALGVLCYRRRITA